MPRSFSLCLLALLPLLGAGCSSNSRVVLYCAQDPEYAEGILRDFIAGTRFTVAPKFDTEANKSVSLVEELLREAKRPRCDVFWNNEILGTIRLQRRGLLEPYDGPAAAPFPAWTKGPDHSWQAFASRARVIIVNTKLVPEAERPKSVLDLTRPRWKGKVAIAKPEFGTTATQAACLFEVLGPEAAKGFYRGLKANGATVVPGNKQVADGVGAGDFALGLTDTDDAIGVLKEGKPVALVFPDRDGHPDHPRLGTLYIPNTLAIIRGGPDPQGARKLVDYLLSPEVEKKLAEGGGYQFPLNPDVKAELPPELLPPEKVKRMDVDFEKAADLWDEVQTFMRQEFGR